MDWHSVDEVYLYSDATTSKIARTVTQKLGFSKGIWQKKSKQEKRSDGMPHLANNFHEQLFQECDLVNGGDMSPTSGVKHKVKGHQVSLYYNEFYVFHTFIPWDSGLLLSAILALQA